MIAAWRKQAIGGLVKVGLAPIHHAQQISCYAPAGGDAKTVVARESDRIC